MGHPSLGKGSATAINIIAILTLCLLVLYKIVLSTEKNVVKEININKEISLKKDELYGNINTQRIIFRKNYI